MTSLLLDMLDLAVPLRIMEYERSGGPASSDFERARAFGVVLASEGDVLLFGGRKGRAAELFNGLTDAVAVMSFCPGGVKVGRSHYNGRVPGAEIPHHEDRSLEAFLERLRRA